MKRSIKIERLYTLGDYKNIKFIESIEDIDEDLALDEQFMKKLYTQLMVSCDLNYLRYKNALKNQETSGRSPEEMMENLDKLYDTLGEELDTFVKEEE